MKLSSTRLTCVLGMMAALGASPALAQRVNLNDTRTSTAIESVFVPVVRSAAASTVKVKYAEANGVLNQAALGTVISEDGYILTKASEVIGWDRITVQLSKGGDLNAKVVGYNETLDLAMLKVEAKGLIPVVFADTRAPARVPAPANQPTVPASTVVVPGFRGRVPIGGPIPVATMTPAPPEGAIGVEVGKWVATPDAAASAGKELPPRSVGVISTARRVVPRLQGFLGVSMEDAADGSGVKILEVVDGTAAAQAGLKANDVVKALEGRPLKATSGSLARDILSNVIRSYAVGDAVRVYVQRGSENLVLRAVLGENAIETAEDVEIAKVSGSVSKRATFSPVVPMTRSMGLVSSEVTLFEHDTILAPADMGGPLVDLDGHVIGINIARAGRTETFALPADIVVPALERLKSGMFAPLPAKPPDNP